MATNPSAEVTSAQASTSATTTEHDFAARLWAKLCEVVEIILPEAFATILLVVVIAVAKKLLDWLIGDYKFFDYLPVRWVFDAGHLTIIIYFVFRILRKFHR